MVEGRSESHSRSLPVVPKPFFIMVTCQTFWRWIGVTADTHQRDSQRKQTACESEKGLSSLGKQALWSWGPRPNSPSPQGLSTSVNYTLVGLIAPKDMLGLCGLPLKGQNVLPGCWGWEDVPRAWLQLCVSFRPTSALGSTSGGL